MKNFWQQLEKPIVALAPMADVTDPPFRKLFAKYGKPDVTWTEFVSADGLVLAPHEPKDKYGMAPVDKLRVDLTYSEDERPIVAQLFSSHPDRMEAAAKYCAEQGFDGIDINMGCPDKSIEKQLAGSAMIKHPQQAAEIIAAAKRGAGDIPVSVKTRVGYNSLDDFEGWISHLLRQDIACLSIHWRTRKELSKVPAHWELAPKAVALRNKIAPNTIILGNGDIASKEDAYQKIKETGIDGVMVGRGIFGNPWFFNKEINRDTDISIEERLRVMLEHTALFSEMLPHKTFAVMKKHYKAYLSPVASAKGDVDGFAGAKELRVALMETKDVEEVREVVEEFLSHLSSPH